MILSGHRSPSILSIVYLACLISRTVVMTPFLGFYMGKSRFESGDCRNLGRRLRPDGPTATPASGYQRFLKPPFLRCELTEKGDLC